MRILCTGGAGFLGSHLVDVLIDAGHEVVTIDNYSTGSEGNLNVKAGNLRDDLCLRNSILYDVRVARPEVVYHLAAQSSYRACVADPRKDASINVGGTINLLEACRLAGVRKLIFASSAGGVYGDQPTQPVDETAQPLPLTQYGVSKLAGEEYIKQYSRLYGLDYTILRLGNVYGPRQNPHGEAGVVSKMIHAALSGKSLTVTGDGMQSRDFVYVSDVVSAFIAALSMGSGEVYNIANGRDVTMGALAHWIRDEYSEGANIEYSERVAGEFYRLMLSCEKAYHGLHWYPTVTLEDGLDLTAQWMHSQISEVSP